MSNPLVIRVGRADPGPPPPRHVPLPDNSDAPPRCEHPTTEPRKRTQSNGVVVVVRQCLTCGVNRGAISKAGIPLCSLSAFDEALRQGFEKKVTDHYEARRKQYEAAVAGRDAEFQRWYAAYLQTSKWQRLRERALARDGQLCQGCRLRAATQVHHLTYAHVGNELLFELISVCDSCHEHAHANPEGTR